MTRRRYLSTDISLDTRVNRLAIEYGDFAALLYCWMIPHANDSGSIDGSAEELLWRIAPGRRDKDASEMMAALDGMERCGLIVWHSAQRRVTFNQQDWEHLQSNIAGRVRRKPWDRIRHRLRPIVFKRDGYRCVQCGATEPLEADHIIPIMRGGSNDLENLQTLCRPCNRRKWAK